MAARKSSLERTALKSTKHLEQIALKSRKAIHGHIHKVLRELEGIVKELAKLTKAKAKPKAKPKAKRKAKRKG